MVVGVVMFAVPGVPGVPFLILSTVLLLQGHHLENRG